MPELPEMENYKKLLTEKIAEKTIMNAMIKREKSINVPIKTFQQQVHSQKIISIERRAKHLLFHLENGYILLLHLMLGGWMYYGNEEDKPDRSIQVELYFGDNSLYFIGLRLGYLHLFTKKEVDSELSDLGPEPLDINFSLNAFQDLTKGKKGKLKTTLVDQKFLAGIGNCYSDEICFEAQLLPTRTMNNLNDQEVVQLYHAIRSVLPTATEHGGYMENPLFTNDQKTGGVSNFLKVYDREGESCKRCGATILFKEVSSRKCFYCTGCQH
ncbi:formamidopyrimidine-DNA glycosylase [Salirhabdus euzebyi]|uniref:Formamidopyrimidine-DNA glycosylase n=1 Tax=Salirhabdus euzebyi TaxID=394506 RepID=A0A841PWV2_9BACI|nr:Fpg/Nei family DNA glycosylase [Salirhabdus euzebyi]MBB6452414.1 formamidopyrimidine-DNA glycosylase [Salirhabdus euzebyi]